MRSHFAVVVALLILAVGAPGTAQTPSAGLDLWLPSAAVGAAIDTDELVTVFTEVLGGPAGSSHVVGEAGIAARLSTAGPTMPRCLAGLDAPCGDPATAAAAVVGATRVIWVTARQERHSSPATLELVVLDLALGTRRVLQVDSPTVREAVFTAVAELTSAVASLSITSEPTGAEVYLDGRLLGVTPYSGTVSIGAYDLRLVLDGYYDYGSPIELRADDQRTEQIDMQRRFATLRIDTDAPGAQIVVDAGDPQAANAPLQILPGRHEVIIRAPGYDDEIRTLDLIASEERQYRVTLVESAVTIANRRYEAVRSRPLAIQLGAVGASARTSWRDARVVIDDERERIECASASGPSTECVSRVPTGLLGLDATAIVSYQWFELQLGGFGVRRINTRRSPATLSTRETVPQDVLLEDGRELVFRLPSPGIRWQIDEKWSTSLRVGPAVSFQRLAGRAQPVDEDVRLRRTDWLLNFDLAGRRHLTEALYAFGEFNLGVTLDEAGTRTRLGASLGLGVIFPDPTGLLHSLTRRQESRDAPPSPSTPSEL
ncbi:MAG: PEGA domain-containing protein [Myxococcales bacterium]|nr:PEGA domain-containing protein [Myxococcales bacterium]MCB9520658.1 PEGA domain-containing protein [Myxococcales bacterium]